ncbi:HopJ type III effector protein [Aliikangiella sp. IMCC44359]|uniref:HopJ type III effector protein n=1 Tax=Aliikangiella sp. IMCC44359 TaxID=3459125 RepID=UPI00403AFC91
MNLNQLIKQIKTTPNDINFIDIIQCIDTYYDYTPTSFQNGALKNEMGTNEGSCKIFYFADLNKLNQQQTLACFGHYYREDVLENPQGEDHKNIRNFMKTGWTGIQFEGEALALK